MSGDILSDLTDHEDPFRWLFLGRVQTYENAGCLEACPTGSFIRTEVGSVLVQNDILQGCGCVVGCPFGVIDRRKKPLKDAGAFRHLLLRPAGQRPRPRLRERYLPR